MKMDVVSSLIFLNVFHAAVTNDSNMCGLEICCTGYFLQDNKCTECYPGKIGNNCIGECPEGYYGKKCKERCPTMCLHNCNKSTGICLEIETFLEDKLLIIVAASSVLVIISCSCIGVFLLCKDRQKKKRTFDNATSINQNQLSSKNERNESDINIHNYNSCPILSLCGHNKVGAKSFTDKNETDESEVVYSKPKPKKCYNRVQELDMSLELTCPDESEGEDVFDSDEFDDDTDARDNVELFGFNKNQSVLTFKSSTDTKQTSTAYEHMF